MLVQDRVALISQVCDMLTKARRPSKASITSVMFQKDWALWRNRWLSSSRAVKSDLAFDEHHIIGRIDYRGTFRVLDCTTPGLWTKFTSLNPKKLPNNKRMHIKLDVLGQHGFYQAPILHTIIERGSTSFFIVIKNRRLSKRSVNTIRKVLKTLPQHVIIVV